MALKHQQSKDYKALLNAIEQLDKSVSDVDERIYNAIASPELEAPIQPKNQLPGLDTQPTPLNIKALFPAKLGKLAISETLPKVEKEDKPADTETKVQDVPSVSIRTPEDVKPQQSTKTKESLPNAFNLPTQLNTKLDRTLQEKSEKDKEERAITSPKLKVKENKAAKKMTTETNKNVLGDDKKTVGKSLKNDAELQKELDAREKKIQDLLDGSKGSSISSGTV